jgi:LmbE family N-acetylglucosaminyl deacetylase
MDPEYLPLSGRVLLLAAHPDDEVIGAGAQLPKWKDRVFILHATDGAPRNPRFAAEAGFESREAYAAERRRELLRALAVAGILQSELRTLRISDQDAMLHLPELTSGVAGIIDELEPDCILTHPYEGGHPDHDACAFAARAALLLSRPQPVLGEFTSYHAGQQGIETGGFLPAPSRSRLGGMSRAGEITFTLTDEERALKRRMFDCYASQRNVLDWFTISSEKFRRAPDYDFSQPPHRGQLMYECHNWGIDGASWREYAASAFQQLGIEHAANHS